MRSVVVLLSISTALAGSSCMLTPTNGSSLGSKTDPLDFSGYDLYPDAGVFVQALNPTTSAWETLATTRSAAKTSVSIGSDPLYAWSARTTLPSRFWTTGSRGRGARAQVRTTGDTPSGTYAFMSVEPDWGDCYSSLESPSASNFYNECRSPQSPVADVTVGSWVEPVWGIADLHAHPATHLAFGNDGLFWGNPGLALGSSDPAADLIRCATDKHYGSQGDAVTHNMRIEVMKKLDAQTGHPHTAGGSPDFAGWPHALSLMHQQMHVRWLRRAYEGGVRLMFASTTDNEVLDMLIHRGFNLFGQPTPVPSLTHDYDSARRQLAFIKQLASNNSSWMQVVTTATEARQVMLTGKLALVLSVELDNLTPSQVCALRAEGVRHVVPIHLVDNLFGGTAVSGPVVPSPAAPPGNPFNTANWWFTGGPTGGDFFSLVRDPYILYREGRPDYLHYHHDDLLKGGAVEPMPISDADYLALGYQIGDGLGGHRNARGADSTLIERLLRQGFMVDVSHMSQLSTSNTLAVAQRLSFPVMSSHTGLRADTVPSSSERALLQSHARIVRSLGGVLGMGTARRTSSDPIVDWVKDYSDIRQIFGANIALGTDFNGLQEQLVSTGRTTTYPITTASTRAPLRLRGTAPQLTQYTLGTRAFTGQTDGLAHYGMLPEFTQALETVPADTGVGRLSGTQVVNELFQSAEATLVYWEKVEEATTRLGGAAACP
ncbi:MAG: membrane dipeptidase [Myxococcota bacterium]